MTGTQGMRNFGCMPATVEQVTHEALNLSEKERAALAHALLRSLDVSDEKSEVEAAWTAEITRRAERVRQGKAKGKPAEEVFRAARARCH